LLFISGQVGRRADGTPEPNFAAQVQLTFDNLKATLAAAGGRLMICFMSQPFIQILKISFRQLCRLSKNFSQSPSYPNWTAVGVTCWRGLILKLR